MPRFAGVVGYGAIQEIPPGSGKWDDVITERSYFGDVVRNTRKIREGEKVNDDITTGNSISIVADEFANGHFFDIRYVTWLGVQWKVADVEVQSPRLILRLGGVYNGPDQLP